MIACAVAVHFHSALGTLSDIHHRHATLSSLAENVCEPLCLWSISTTETSHHDAVKVGHVEHILYELLLNAGEETEDDDPRVEFGVRNHRLRIVGCENMVSVICEVHSCITQVGIVFRIKGTETIDISLSASVASQQSAREIYAHLWQHGTSLLIHGRGKLYARDEILLTVGAQLSYRELRPSEDYRFGEVFKHKRQSRCRVCHGVGAMQDDKSVVFIIVGRNDSHQLRP